MQIAQNDLCQQETTNPTIVAHQDMTVDGNFGLDAVANHNASTAAQDYDSFTNTKNIDVYVRRPAENLQSFTNNVPARRIWPRLQA